MNEIISEAKLAIVGGRNFTDYNYLKLILDVYKRMFGISFIISGGAPGADTLVERYARENEIDTTIFRAHWSKDGRSAGPRRNLRIAHTCDVMIAFPDKNSRGTYNAIGLAKKLNKPVFVFKHWEITSLHQIIKLYRSYS